MTNTRNDIILAGDDLNILKNLQQLFNEQQGNHQIVLTIHAADILQQLIKHPPLLIILYLPNAENSYVTYIKALRDNKAADEVPVYSYATLPTITEINDLLKNLR